MVRPQSLCPQLPCPLPQETARGIAQWAQLGLCPLQPTLPFPAEVICAFHAIGSTVCFLVIILFSLGFSMALLMLRTPTSLKHLLLLAS